MDKSCLSGWLLAGCASLLIACSSDQPGQEAAPVASPQAKLLGVWNGVSSPEDPAGPAPWSNTPWPAEPGFTAWGEAESKRLSDPRTHQACKPAGPIFAMNGSGLFPIQFLETPGQIVIMFENIPIPRRIYMDGRGHPPDLDPTWMGHSIGHWEGDVLVVDTVGTNGKVRPMNNVASGAVTSSGNDRQKRLPVSEQLHLVERIQVVGAGEFLEVDMTIEDPKTYTGALHVKRYWQRRPDLDMLEYYCEDNMRPEDEGYVPEAPPP